MLTVREALELSVLSSARVVAGHAGLENQINWVHVVDMADAHYEWNRRGVLLLTAGFGLRDAPERAAALVPKLVEQGFAGLVLSTGCYFQEAPPIIKRDANALNFPVIETPLDVLFIDVTEAILERIVNRQHKLLQQSTQIFTKLTKLVLQGANLSDLAHTLASFLHRSITIEDVNLRVLAAAQQGPVDEARQKSVENGRTTHKVAKHLLESGIYTRLLEQMEPLHVPPISELGMMMERFVAPIIVDREIYGYIWIIAGDHPLTSLDEMTISHGATVAALILFKEQAVREAEEALRGDFFEQLLSQNFSEDFPEQARRLNFRLNQSHQALLIAYTSESRNNIYALMKPVEQWLSRSCSHALLARREDRLALVIESDDMAQGKKLAERLVQELSHPAQKLLVSVGKVSESGQDGAGSIWKSYQEAQESIRIGTATGKKEGVIAFNELGLLHWLYHLPLEVRNSNDYLKQIYKLAAYDAKRGTKLVHTLDVYLDHAGSQVDAAEALHIHRNTLLHRLERIEKVCSMDLREPLHRLNLHAAVKGYWLHK